MTDRLCADEMTVPSPKRRRVTPTAATENTNAEQSVAENTNREQQDASEPHFASEYVATIEAALRDNQPAIEAKMKVLQLLWIDT